MTDEEREAFLASLAPEMLPQVETPSGGMTDEARMAYLQTLTGSPAADAPTPDAPAQDGEMVGGWFGAIPRADYDRGERNWAGNAFERPSAALRGGIQALRSGGQTPQQGYLQGVQNPSSVPTFSQQAQQVTDRLTDFVPRLPPQLAKALTASPFNPIAGVGMAGQVAGQAADYFTNPAAILTGLGVSGAVGAVAKTPVGQTVGRFLTKERSLPQFGRPRIETVEEVLKVPEARLPKLTQRERSAYFQARSQQIREQVTAQSQALKDERIAIQRELGKEATKRSLYLRDQLPGLYAKQSRHYRALVDKELAPVANNLVTDTELRAFLTQRFAKDPERLNAVSSRLGLGNNPPQPILSQVVDEAGRPFQTGETTELTHKLGELYQKTLDFGHTLPRAVLESTRVYSPADDLTDDAIASIVDFLETKGVSLKSARSFWRSWAPIRNQATREFRPFLEPDVATGAGSRRLIQQAKGMDPDNEVYATTLSQLLGIDDLPGELKGVVRKLTTNQKAKLAVTMQQQEASGALKAMQFRANQIADKELRRWEKIRLALGLLGATGGVTAGIATLRK